MDWNWRYGIKSGYEKLTTDPLQWKQDEDYHVALQRNGYQTSLALSGGDSLSNTFCYDVFSRVSGEGTPFVVSVDVNGSGYFVFVDDFPSLIELLNKMAPIAREASAKVQEELAEEERKSRESVSHHG